MSGGSSPIFNGGSSFKATPEDIRDASAHVSMTASDVEDAINEFQNYITGIEPFWGGVASTQFQDLMQDYHTNANRLRNVLQQIGDSLGATHANISDVESQNNQIINQASAGLIGGNFR